MKVSLIAIFILVSIASFITQKFKFKQESSVTITFWESHYFYIYQGYLI